MRVSPLITLQGGGGGGCVGEIMRRRSLAVAAQLLAIFSSFGSPALGAAFAPPPSSLGMSCFDVSSPPRPRPLWPQRLQGDDDGDAVVGARSLSKKAVDCGGCRRATEAYGASSSACSRQGRKTKMWASGTSPAVSYSDIAEDWSDGNATSPSSSPSPSSSSLEIVLFGIGDLRVHDHGGLTRAWNKCASEGATSRILPLFVFDESSLGNVPGAAVHTLDTAAMITSAVESLSASLRNDLGLSLNLCRGSTASCLVDIVDRAGPSLDTVNVHVCDLGPADVSMGYSPYSAILDASSSSLSSFNLVPWTCNLRDGPDGPWEMLSDLPSTYAEYMRRYCESVEEDSPIQPLPLPNHLSARNQAGKEEADAKGVSSVNQFSIPSASSTSTKQLPELDEVLSMLLPRRLRALPAQERRRRLEEGKGSGLYGTHWGGFNNGLCTEADAAECLRAYADCGSDDDAFLRSSYYRRRVSSPSSNNPRSLEHASLAWMAAGGAKNLIDGESALRSLAAPLLLGCVSCRQVRSSGATSTVKDSNGGRWSPFSFILKNKPPPSPLAEAAEAREWHRLFAASNMLRSSERHNSSMGREGAAEAELTHRYWRWHGFLCRYAISDLVKKQQNELGSPSSSSASPGPAPPRSRSGIVLVHGFGASGSQWKKTMLELSREVMSSSPSDQMRANEVEKVLPGMAFAPDLLGFGQSEKPALTYTQYLWESYIAAFAKEICIEGYDCERFILGGNSIGGYTSMGVAADDAITSTVHGREDVLTVTASGAPGSGRCVGVALMNTAGRILTREEAEENEAARQPSVAELTAKDGLPPCSPPPKAIASIGGRALLWYLRPRIKSICVNLYPSNPSAVDDDLCNGILRDSLDPGALSVIVSGSKLPPPRTANELLGSDFGAASEKDVTVVSGKWTGPVLVPQGMQDPLNDASGRALMLQSLRSGVEVTQLEGGHCVHDELPKETAKVICRWILKNKLIGRSASTTAPSSAAS